MTPANWAGIIVSIIAIVSAFAGSIRWLVKHYLSELKFNSGSSMRDELKELSKRVDVIYQILIQK